MSGHSKWNNIKRKKEATDAIKGKIFTKIGREITVCVKEGGPDPSSNAKLRDLIAKAKSNNVPNDNIDRVIKKAAGEGDKNNYESIVYEGYGPCGVAVIVECLTDNKNRTAGNVRHYFDKFGGNLGASGCVSWSFDKKGVIVIEDEDEELDEDQVMMDALDAGAADYSLIPVRKLLNKFMASCGFCRRNHLFFRSIGISHTDVVQDALLEQERILKYEADLIHQRIQRNVPNVNAADLNTSVRHIIKPGD